MSSSAWRPRSRRAVRPGVVEVEYRRQRFERPELRVVEVPHYLFAVLVDERREPFDLRRGLGVGLPGDLLAERRRVLSGAQNQGPEESRRRRGRDAHVHRGLDVLSELDLVLHPAPLLAQIAHLLREDELADRQGERDARDRRKEDRLEQRADRRGRQRRLERPREGESHERDDEKGDSKKDPRDCPPVTVDEKPDLGPAVADSFAHRVRRRRQHFLGIDHASLLSGGRL
ncbi:hypothetical protein [Halalkalicoccus paucihalophilus]|uniref:hypothetical protein n=1 Tax=Halalkalicoccus paucihalophilus TaxID=1008153 RepID=UPI000A8912C4|nr:hypothetical protein [Halalkalicoccus paucihalophilus]